MISQSFSVDDIIEVRRQIDTETAGMSVAEFFAYVHRGSVEMQRRIEARRAEKRLLQEASRNGD